MRENSTQGWRARKGDNGWTSRRGIGAGDGRFSRRRLLLSNTMKTRQAKTMLVVSHEGRGSIQFD